MSARQTARWTDGEGITDLSVAIDEIYFLKALLADEAGILDAHLGYATFPKSRRTIGEASVERMMRAARGEGRAVSREGFDARLALMRADAPQTLTNASWAAQRGLVPIAKGASDE